MSGEGPTATEPGAATIAVTTAIAAALALLLVVAFCVANGPLTSWNEFPLDDAWIHQVYVGGLAREGIPSYNPGRPEAGFSSPLWLAVSLPFHVFGAAASGGSPVVAVKLASLLFAAVAAVALALLGVRLGADRRLAVVGPVLVLASPGFAFSAVSGMEVTVTAAALAAGLLFLARGRSLLAGLLLGLAALGRPEAGFAPVVAALSALTSPGSTGERVRRAALLLAPAALFGALWVAYDLAVTGHPLPTTFYVKAGTGGGAVPGARYFVARVLLDAGIPYALAVGALYLLGVRRAWREPGRRPVVAVLVAVQVVPMAGVAATHPLAHYVLFYCQRYFYPFTILAAAFVLVGLAELLALARTALPPRTRGAARAAIAVGLALAAFPGLVTARDRYAGHCRDVHGLHTVPAREAAQLTGPGQVIAVEGAGAARFHAGRPTLDLGGLNDHRLAHASDPRRRACYIASARPALFLVPEEWLPGLSPGFTLTPVRRYESPLWSVTGGQSRRVVVAATAQLRPGIEDLCRDRGR